MTGVGHSSGPSTGLECLSRSEEPFATLGLTKKFLVVYELEDL
jgi:hypothetical protein